jgi:hypothetical protein
MGGERQQQISYLVEALAFSAFVGMYIWRWQAEWPPSGWLMGAWLVVSAWLREDRPKLLGWRADNLAVATRNALLFFVPAALAVCGAGLFLGMMDRMPEHLIQPRRFLGYLAFCVLQQVALNSFLTNRLLRYFGPTWQAALFSGVIFAALHWPNPVLVPLTLIGGAAMAWLFAHERNILPLALGQAVLGALVWWAFPMSWHHSMRVGPGYWAFHL